MKRAIRVLRPLASSVLLVLGAAAFAPGAAAAEASQPAAAPQAKPDAGAPAAPDAQLPGGEAERLNVENIKQKYWARGDEGEIGVVQNRLYSKEHKLELGIYGGLIATDPFLSVHNLGTSLGFHFNEYLSLHFLAWKSFTNPSSALTFFQQSIGATTESNPVNGYYGGEIDASMLYGKLSVLGKAIIYYDLHLSGGGGVTLTDNGNFGTAALGIGQRFFITKTTSFRIDYRLMRYDETITEKVIPTKLGQVIGTRTNYSDVVTIGLSFMFGVLK